MDLERLLAPISADAPAGESLRYEGTYDRIREARREDDPSLPQGVWEAKLKTADWKTVISMCTGALERRSKDLQIAVWLAEAWLQQGGFGAAASGILLVSGLCERYWDELHPTLEGDEGGEARANLIEWMDEVFARKLRILPFSGEQGSYCLLDWETGPSRGRETDATGEPAPPRVSGQDDFLSHVSLVGRGVWLDLHRHSGEALIAADALAKDLAERMPSAPTLRRMRDALRVIVHVAETALRVSGGAPEGAEPSSPSSGSAPGAAGAAPASGSPSGPSGPSGPIKSRAEAYYRLAEAAEYLLRTEPHSPVPYLVKRAVGWGNMSLAELLHEFIGSPDDLVAIQRLLGMRSRDE